MQSISVQSGGVENSSGIIPESEIQLIKASPELIPSFHRCLDMVARERVYIELIEAPPLEKTIDFQMGLISQGLPAVYALHDGHVVGWCDVSPIANPRLRHRGILGMGIAPGYRGQGLGTRLLSETLIHAEAFGLAKVELSVYSSNLAAVNLYKKLGFVREGLISNYRQLEGQTFNCILMAKNFPMNNRSSQW